MVNNPFSIVFARCGVGHARHIALPLTAAIVVGITTSACSKQEPIERNAAQYDLVTLDDANQKIGRYTIPQDTAIVDEPNADQIFYGKRLLNETKRLLPEHVGAAMNCNSCHIAQGKIPLGDPYINSYNFYPRVMPRAGKEVDLQARINGCFQRSMNGKPVPRESDEMKAMVAYMKWLAQNTPKHQLVDIRNAGVIDESLVPDPQHGEQIYYAQCATCHGDNGEGMKDSRGDIVFPPLWGEESFNIGAGMARTYKAAAFVKYNMPMGIQTKGLWGHGNVLSDQDAVDVAEFFTHKPRPDFPGKVNDWPNRPKPKDARY
ncbi:cytochrome C [Stutzerimonas decontaminans]|uniref:Cytochrome C n=1 Tax=Stutzerimonas stutzeri TaxID=316 RepID=A0A023WSJ8_STUST|nr:c-type cytochrome [Stutzerimonas decontaminans]AHY42794.1 cytochrome C [Stutzerimonas decontaminans]